jgi:hypothetical protein
MTDIIKSIDKMTDEELLALAESLEAEAREHQEHGEEIRTYTALRGGERRAA